MVLAEHHEREDGEATLPDCQEIVGAALDEERIEAATRDEASRDLGLELEGTPEPVHRRLAEEDDPVTWPSGLDLALDAMYDVVRSGAVFTARAARRLRFFYVAQTCELALDLGDFRLQLRIRVLPQLDELGVVRRGLLLVALRFV